MSPALLLRSARQLRGLSQRELASRAGVAHSVVARIESGRSNPGWATVTSLLEAAAVDVRLCLPPTEPTEVQRHWLRLSTSARLYWSLGGRQHHLFDRLHPVWVALGLAATGRCLVLDPAASVGIWLEDHAAAQPLTVWTPSALDVWGRGLAAPAARADHNGGAALEVRVGPVGTRGLVPVGVTHRAEVWAHPPDHPLLQTGAVTSRRLQGVAAALHEGRRRDVQGRRGAAHKDSRSQHELAFVMARRRFGGLPAPDPRERRDWRLGGEASFREWLAMRGFRLHQRDDL